MWSPQTPPSPRRKVGPSNKSALTPSRVHRNFVSPYTVRGCGEILFIASSSSMRLQQSQHCMLNDFFSNLRFPLSWSEFQQIPRHPAYRYEYRSGEVRISGHPLYRHARLNLAPDAPLPGREPAAGNVTCFFSQFELSAVSDRDWSELPKLFAGAFSRTPPLSTLEETQRLSAAERLLERTRTGQDGPLLPAASKVVCERDSGELIGAILVTLVPNGDPEDFSHPEWQATPPSDAVQSRWGQPHLTWIFLPQSHQRKQLGTVLLSAAASGIRQAGYSHLLSTFLVGDHVSMLWHWKNRFELIPGPSRIFR
jgi:hypothetical protein